MSRKVVLLMTWVIVFIGMVSVTISTETSVGVKEGDWIEYNVTVTGNPPSPYQPVWFRTEILGVEGQTVTIKTIMNRSDGIQDITTASVNITESQVLGDKPSPFVIPANLEAFDTFYLDDYGNVTLAGATERSYVNTSRTVVYASLSAYGETTTVYWEQETGFLLESYQTEVGVYSMTIKASNTNMWQPQPSGLPIDPTVFYILIIIAVVIVVAVVFFVITRRKKPAEEIVSPPQT